ncbi:hypothetical protein H8E88_34845 [candidate division KSB1 bacterium]|nr:hypothetical protein [candidate division KSB1 bacterium]MBL7092742.1 hypothetical protein [candidate division KSB1 bacterium]
MLAIKGIYDGETFKALDSFPKGRKYKIFVEEIKNSENEEIRNFSAQTNGLSFWEDEHENLYQDYFS